MNRAFLIAGLIVIVVVVTGIYFAYEKGYITPKPELKMQVESSLDTWVRNELDHPVARYTLDINVENSGSGDAESVNLDFTLQKDGRLFRNGTVVLGDVLNRHSQNATEQIELGDGMYEISLNLKTASFVWDTFDDSFSVNFPRSSCGETVRFYITPNDPTVKSCASSLGYSINSLYSWVGDQIHYAYDSDVYGVTDYWQLPYETLNLKQGDCEDQAFLLASLVRASGILTDSVFVAVGEVYDSGHAWVILKSGSGWRVYEPTAEGILERIFVDVMEFLGLSDREYYFASNDFYFEEIDPSSNLPYITQSFQAWFEDDDVLSGTRVATSLDRSVKLKVRVRNDGYYNFIGLIKIEIKKDIVWGTDIVFTKETYSITLKPNEPRFLEMTFSPDEETKDAIGCCRQYYYKVYTSFSCVYDPTNSDNRECVFAGP